MLHKFLNDFPGTCTIAVAGAYQPGAHGTASL